MDPPQQARSPQPPLFSPISPTAARIAPQSVDIAALRAATVYGANGDPETSEPAAEFLWGAAASLDNAGRRQLLQFWSGSDAVPPGGFGELESGFKVVFVSRLYAPGDATARLPVAHTCFRQLDWPRYASEREAREKLATAITHGQGAMLIT